MTMQEYWQKVRVVSAQMPGDVVTLISVETTNTKAGSVVTVDRTTAARRLVDRTHRIATAEEIAKFEEQTEAQLEKDRAREARRIPTLRRPYVIEEPPAPVARRAAK